MQQQKTQADSSSVPGISAHKPLWQQQQQMHLSRRLTSSSTTSGSQHGQQVPGTSRPSLVRRRVTVPTTPPTAAAAAAAAQETAAEDGSSEPFKSVSSVPSWVFGARQQLQQQHTQAGASKRLHSSSKAQAAALRGVPLRQQQEQHKLMALVAGYTVEEAANDLLPLLLEFAPAGSSVVIAVAADSAAAAAADDQGQQQQQQQSARQQLPEGLDWEGQLEAEEEPQHAGAAPVLHSINYRYLAFIFRLCSVVVNPFSNTFCESIRRQKRSRSIQVLCLCCTPSSTGTGRSGSLLRCLHSVAAEG
jgi:hypothetical protein